MARTTYTSITKRPPVYSPERKMIHKRNDIGFESLNETVENVRNRSPNVSSCDSEEAESPECSDLTQREDNVNPSSFVYGGPWHIALAVLAVLAALVVAIGFVSPARNPETSDKDHNRSHSMGDKVMEWENDIRNLQDQFPSQSEKLWGNFFTGIKTIVTVKPVKPSVFLLLHNDDKTAACLAHKVAKQAIKFLSETEHEPIIINGEDMKKKNTLKQDYGLFAEMHKDDIMQKHVMIVLNLQEIPAVLAQTFHSLCDGENPVVHKAAYLFTMNVEGNVGNPTDKAENTLKMLWNNTLDIDILEPLITRITDTVLTLTSEMKIPC